MLTEHHDVGKLDRSEVVQTCLGIEERSKFRDLAQVLFHQLEHRLAVESDVLWTCLFVVADDDGPARKPENRNRSQSDLRRFIDDEHIKRRLSRRTEALQRLRDRHDPYRYRVLRVAQRAAHFPLKPHGVLGMALAEPLACSHVLLQSNSMTVSERVGKVAPCMPHHEFLDGVQALAVRLLDRALEVSGRSPTAQARDPGLATSPAPRARNTPRIPGSFPLGVNYSRDPDWCTLRKPITDAGNTFRSFPNPVQPSHALEAPIPSRPVATILGRPQVAPQCRSICSHRVLCQVLVEFSARVDKRLMT